MNGISEISSDQVRFALVSASLLGEKCLHLVSGRADARIVGVVTAPEVFSISYRPQGVKNVLYSDLGRTSREQDIECLTLTSGMNDSKILSILNRWRPDFFLVAGWYHMVTRKWMEIAPAYGLHASLLPDYAGGAPLVWAMINGETTTGVTLFKMDEGVDSGPIVDQIQIPILQADTIDTLYQRAEASAVELVSRNLRKLANKDLTLKPQDLSKRRVMRQRSPEDGRISWDQPAEVVDRFVRAQTRPYPGAFTLVGSEPVTIWKTKVAASALPLLMPGDLLHFDGITYCGTTHSAVALHEVEWNGRSLKSPEKISQFLGTRGIKRFN